MTYFYDAPNRLLYQMLVPLCLLNAVLWQVYTKMPLMTFIWAMVAFGCIAFLRRNF